MSSDHQGSDAAHAVAAATTNIRCVIVVDPEQPAWLTANTAAVLGVALGGHGLIPLGPDVADAHGEKHPGIGALPLPVLAAAAEKLPELRRKAQGLGLYVIDFNAAAHDSRTYPEYEHKLTLDEPRYLGIAIHGAATAVNSVTRKLKSLR